MGEENFFGATHYPTQVEHLITPQCMWKTPSPYQAKKIASDKHSSLFRPIVNDSWISNGIK
jgi:hypothetical protein